MSIRLITRLSSAPSVEPVTLTETKLHLRLATTAVAAAAYTNEDDLLNALIAAARTQAENYTRRAFITQTWIAYLDSFPSTLRLPYPPFQSVTSLTVEGTAFTDFTESKRGILAPTDTWPILSSSPGADPIVITYKAGYGDAAADVPAPIQQAILLLLATWYANRENVVIGVSVAELPEAAKALLNPYRWMEL